MAAKKQKEKLREKVLKPAKAIEKTGLWRSPLPIARQSPAYARMLILNNGAPERKARMLLLAALAILCLLPFAGKAFHIDDPLFIWSAKNIQAHPLDPYGFDVNWYGTDMRMADINKNPPIVAYYIAIVAAVFGFSETALHLAFLIPAIAAVIGTFLIAEKFCDHPLLAGLIALLTPVFLVSSTTVMSDIMMLAFWVFAVYFWISGLEKNSDTMLLLSAVLIPICTLTKYFGITLIPLLLSYSVFKQRKVGKWALFMLLPVAVLALYQWETYALYGRGLLMDAASYAIEARSQFGKWSLAKTLVGLAFTGGCILAVLFFTNLVWSWKQISAGVALAIIIAIATAFSGAIGNYQLQSESVSRWIIAVEFAVFICSGISLLAIAILDFKDRRDAEAVLLLFWIVGTFIFAAFINWTTASRSILPMVPAAGMLIVRRIEKQTNTHQDHLSLKNVLAPLIGVAVVSLAVTWADYTFAGNARAACIEIKDQYMSKEHNTWFTGHWGFQYYMQNSGARPYDSHFRPSPGDIFIVPVNNSNSFWPPREYVRLRAIVEKSPGIGLSTLNAKLGAGFYSDVFGPLPFAVGEVPSDQYYIFEVIR